MSNGLGFMVFWRFGGKGALTDLISELINQLNNDWVVCRTAPATLGMLITLECYLHLLVCSHRRGLSIQSAVQSTFPYHHYLFLSCSYQVKTTSGDLAKQKFMLDLFNPIPFFTSSLFLQTFLITWVQFVPNDKLTFYICILNRPAVAGLFYKHLRNLFIN